MHLIFVFLVINPAMKLEWFRKHQPDRLSDAKELFVDEVNVLSFEFSFG